MRSRWRSERGSVTVEMVVALPLLMLVVWIGMGAAMFYYGRTTALAAAQSGVAAFAAEHGTTAACQQAALDLAGRVGDALSSPKAVCTLAGNTVTATVSGTVLSLVPGWAPRVSQTATMPVERTTG